MSKAFGPTDYYRMAEAQSEATRSASAFAHAAEWIEEVKDYDRMTEVKAASTAAAAIKKANEQWDPDKSEWLYFCKQVVQSHIAKDIEAGRLSLWAEELANLIWGTPDN